MYYMVARIYRPVIIFLPIQLGTASKFLSSPHVMVADPFTMYPTSQVTVRVSWNLGKVEEDTLPFFISGMGHVISSKLEKYINKMKAKFDPKNVVIKILLHSLCIFMLFDHYLLLC